MINADEKNQRVGSKQNFVNTLEFELYQQGSANSPSGSC